MTPLARRIFAEHRNVIAILAIALVVNAFAYVLVVRPLALLSRPVPPIEPPPRDGLAAERELAQADALVKGKAQADEQPMRSTNTMLPADMTAARRMTYASFAALARKAGVRYDARTTTVDAVDRAGRLEKMSIQMVLEGDYDGLRQFIYSARNRFGVRRHRCGDACRNDRRGTAASDGRHVHLLPSGARCLLSASVSTCCSVRWR